MLQLKRETAFAAGGNRLCYVHPEQPQLCLKVQRPEVSPRQLRARASWYKRMRPLTSYDDNQREWRAYQQLKRFGEPPKLWRHIPRHHGFVQTDMGAASVTTLIRDLGDGQTAAGEISISLRDWLARYSASRMLCVALSEWEQFALELPLQTRNMLLHNMVVQRQNGLLRLVLIDGLGNALWINLGRWHKGFARRRTRAKIRRMHRYLAEALSA